MRDIKFRAWDGLAMEYGGFFIHAGGMIFIQDEAITKVRSSSPVMQYTGLRDRNGVEIYEGDILGISDEFCGVVVFEEGCFRLDIGSFTQENTFINSVRCKRFEVIGNIHQNPELLEG